LPIAWPAKEEAAMSHVSFAAYQRQHDQAAILRLLQE
jgi:hypothetical protein